MSKQDDFLEKEEENIDSQENNYSGMVCSITNPDDCEACGS